MAYTNANFWRDMAILGASWVSALWGAWHYGGGGEVHGCGPSGAMCE